jgi:protoheme IX farnesyltransferase
LGLAGPFYAVCAGALSLAFTGTAIRVWHDESEHSARQMFAFSLVYLFLIFAVLLVEQIAGGVR